MIFKFGFAILFAAGAAYACRAIVAQIARTLATGEWHGRTGVAYRSATPKSFWFGVCALSVLATLITLAAAFLLIASFLAK
jgi:hypothetical protein